ncbi:MAG: FAD-dependent oxidoreductase [Spirochaetales bacterium]|nr:FAD-dependent oxidoreductase [Spirochaetales bacterium]
MKRYDLIVIGAGPAGLSAAAEAASRGLEVVVFDENEKPGGQLFKQIHKFFGSKEHKAKIWGFRIGEDLLRDAEEKGVRVVLDSVVCGLYQDREVLVQTGEKVVHYKADAVIVATGASENMVPFDGWTLPGVIGAGAAQTMMNLHGIKPGKKIVMLGSGNVGLVVSFQLLQAGCEVLAVVDASPRVGGYGVHAAKLARCGVPFHLSHTVIEASGEESVERVTIGQVDKNWQIVEGTEKTFDADTLCLAVGLSPMSQLLKMAGCEMKETPLGFVPRCDSLGRTSIPGIFVAGDVSGIEEASAAMIEGRISGAAAAEYLGFLDTSLLDETLGRFEMALQSLREGMFAPGMRGKEIRETEEGIPVSTSLLEQGYLGDDELERFPGVVEQRDAVRPVIECTQNIPCNPCQDACKKGCISIGEKITSLPVVNSEGKCTACGMCVAACSGQAIFLVDESFESGYASVTLPYEFYPLPEAGDRGRALDRSGKEICDAEVVEIKSLKAFDSTNLLTMKVPLSYAGQARFFRR